MAKRKRQEEAREKGEAAQEMVPLELEKTSGSGVAQNRCLEIEMPLAPAADAADGGTYAEPNFGAGPAYMQPSASYVQPSASNSNGNGGDATTEGAYDELDDLPTFQRVKKAAQKK